MNGKTSHRGELDPDLNRLTEAVIGAAIEVHRELGVGYLESVYEEALAIELTARSIPFSQQHPVSVLYKGRFVGEGRLGLLVDWRLVVELKTVEAILPIHTAQVLSYLKAPGCPLGLLINFNVPTLKRGIRRIILT